MVPHASFFLHEPEKKKKIPLLVLVPVRTALKVLLRYCTGKIKSNPLEPHFQTSATKSRCLVRTKAAVALPQHLRVHGRVVHFRIKSVTGVMAQWWNVIQEKYTG